MKSLSEVRIDDDEVHMVSIYLDRGDYWQQVQVELPTTLGQIYKHFPNGDMIYVIVDGYLNGVIYRCGNYDDGVWQEYATTMGMA